MKNLILLSAFFIFTLISSAQVLSNFEEGTIDGWHSEGDGDYLWESDTGNPDGCFRVNDDATGDMNRAYAPVRFHGDWSSATISDYISADIFLHKSSGGYIGNNFVFRISGAGGSAKAIYDPAPNPPVDAWITYTVNLVEAQWFVESGSWDAILQNVSTFIVTMEYISGDEFNRLDNVYLSVSPVTVPLSPVICSDFENGLLEGWSFLNTGNYSIQSSGGNPDKYIRINEAGGETSLAIPPSFYHGDWTLLDGHNAEIHIDYKITDISGSLLLPDFFIKISGPGGVATYPANNSISLAFDKWHSFGIPITQAGWTIVSGDWTSIMAYVTDIQVAAEFIDGDEIVGIDNFCISNLPPVTGFVAEKSFVYLGETVKFIDQTISAPESWVWDFGDTGSSTDVNPVYQYSATGTYTTELTTSNHFGNSTETKTNYIEVYPVDECLKYEDNFDDNIIHHAWSFKNGTWGESSELMRQTSNHYVTNNYLEGCFALVGSLLWEDYIVSCDFRSTDNDFIGFVFNYQDESNMYMFRWNKQNSDRRLSKYINGVETVLTSDNVPYVQNDWYHCDIYSISGNLVVSINGIEVFSVFDDTFTNGVVGLYCWGNQSSYYDNFRVECPGTPVEFSVFLEGPFSGSEMITDLIDQDYLASDNPYSNTPPWNHTGSEGVLSFSNPDVVDWVLIDFRDSPSPGQALPGTSIGTNAALLLKDGQVVSPYGGLPIYLNTTITNNLFIVVQHRNHLGIMSSSAVTEVGGLYSFDFTSGAGQAYGTNAQINLGSGKYGMYAGDADANGIVNDDDKIINWMNEAGNRSYIQCDLNLDGQGDNLDKNDVWIENRNKQTQIPD